MHNLGLAYRMELSLDEQWVYLLKSQKIDVVNRNNGTKLCRINARMAMGIVSSPTDQFIAVPIERPSGVRIYRCENDHPLYCKLSFPTLFNPQIVFSHDGKHLFIGAGNRIYDFNIYEKTTQVLHETNNGCFCKSISCEKDRLIAAFAMQSGFGSLASIISVCENGFGAFTDIDFNQDLPRNIQDRSIDWAAFIREDEVIISLDMLPGCIFHYSLATNGENKRLTNTAVYDHAWRTFFSQSKKIYGILSTDRGIDRVSVYNFENHQLIFSKKYGHVEKHPSVVQVNCPSISASGKYLFVPHSRASEIIEIDCERFE